MPAVDTNAERAAGSGTADRKARAFFLAAAVLLGITRVWVGGYSFGGADHSWQIPLVRGIAEGHFLEDYIFKTPPRLSLFFPALAFLGRFWRLEGVCFAGYVAASIAAAVGLYLLAEKMLANRPAALLALVMLLVGKDTVAGATTWDEMFLPRTAAMPLAMFSWWLLLGRRQVLSGLLMGAAFAIHPLTGLYASAISVAAVFIGEFDTWEVLARFAAGMVLPAAAALAYVWGSPTPVWSAEATWEQATLFRNMHHLFCDRYIVLAAVLVYAVFAIAYVGISGGTSRLLAGATAACALVFTYCAGAQIVGHFIGLEFPETALLRPPIIAVMQPLRMTGMFGTLVFVATAGMLWNSLQKGLVGRLAAIAAAVALSSAQYSVGAALLVAALLSQHQAGPSRVGSAAIGLCALIGMVFFYKTLFVLVCAVVVASFVGALATRNTRFSGASAALISIVILTGVVPAGWAGKAAFRAFGSAALADAGGYATTFSLSPTGEKAMLEAASWVRENTGAGDVTIIPPWWESFRVSAERPVYGTYKDGTLVFYNAALAGEWIDRMASIRTPLVLRGPASMPVADRSMYHLLGKDEISQAARWHSARYVVRLADDLPGFRLAYKGSHCHIYEIP